MVESPPDGRPDHIRLLRVIGLGHIVQDRYVTPAHHFSAPLVFSNIHEHTDEPCFFIPRSGWDGCGGPCRLEERLLNKVQGIVGTRDETPCKAVQAFDMRLEQRR